MQMPIAASSFARYRTTYGMANVPTFLLLHERHVIRGRLDRELVKERRRRVHEEGADDRRGGGAPCGARGDGARHGASGRAASLWPAAGGHPEGTGTLRKEKRERKKQLKHRGTPF